MRRVGIFPLFLRRLPSEPVAAVAIAALVLVTSALAATAPRLLTLAADDVLRSTVAAAPVAERDLQLDEQSRIGAGAADAPLGPVEEEGDALQGRVPDTLRATIVDRVTAVDTTRWSVVSQQGARSIVTIRFEPRAFDHVRLVAGRLPAPTSRQTTVPGTGTDPELTVPVVEVAIVDSSAAALGVGIGDTLLLRPDRSDPQAANLPTGTAIEVVGTYAVPNPGDPFWYGESALLHPTVRALSSDVQFLDVFGLAAPAAYTTLYTETQNVRLPFRYHWRLFVDPRRLAAGDAGQLQRDLRRLASSLPPSAFGQGGAVLTSSLLPILTREDGQWQSAIGVLAAIGTGPVAIAAAALGLVAALGATRRRWAAWLWRARGASGSEVVVAAMAEIALVVVPAAALGWAVAAVVVPGPAHGPSLVAAAIVALVGAVLVVATLLPAVRGTALAPPSSRRTSGANAISRRRTVLEATLIAMAIAAAWLLRERSVTGAGGAGAVGVDPLVAVAPALAGVAAGLVAVRVLPLPLALLTRAAASGRGIVAALGLRRATRGAAGGAVLLVLVATAIVGAFSSAALLQLARSADAVAWHDVGAPFLISSRGGVLGANVDPLSTGAEDATGAYRAVVSAGSLGLAVRLLALDPAAYRRVTAGLPVDAEIPFGLLPAGARSSEPLPALVSNALVAARGGVSIGGTFTAVIAGRPTQLRAVAATDAFPTLDPDEAFAVVSRPQLEAARGSPIPTTDLFVRAPNAAAASLGDLVARQASGATIVGESATAASIRDAPIARTVRTGVAVAAFVAAGYAALAVVAALALAASGRAAETAILRMFGLTRRDAVGTLVAEHVPTILVAFVFGVAAGLLLFVALRPGLGLAGVVGSDVAVPLDVEPVHLTLLAAFIGVVTVIGIAIAAGVERRALVAAAVRRGVE
jgi:putative ABC transport system permease protein